MIALATSAWLFPSSPIRLGTRSRAASGCRPREHDRCLDLAGRDAPVGPQELVLPHARDGLEAVTAIEADRPVGGGPRADQDRTLRRAREALEERRSDALPLAGG